MEDINCLKIKGYKDYKMLVENIQSLCLNRKPLIVIPKLLSKSDEEEIVLNIANTLALALNKVLVIDCNLKNINIYKQFNILNNFGLYEILKKGINPKDIIVNIENNLDILTLGAESIDLMDYEISQKMKYSIRYLKKFL